jgi:hypothetical protein
MVSYVSYFNTSGPCVQGQHHMLPPERDRALTRDLPDLKRPAQGKGGGGTGKAVGIGDLGGHVGGPGKVGTGRMVKERVPKAIVKQSRADIDGTMNVNAVAQTIRRGMATVRTCCQRALKRNPDLAGKITIRLNVNTMGKVTSVTVDSDTLGDPVVATCIKGYARRWRFPPSDGGSAEIAVPFNFKSSK